MPGEPSSTHDVFLLGLSACDTTYRSAGLLLEALHERGIRTSGTIEDKDEGELLAPRGDEITAIQASKIVIVVRGYLCYPRRLKVLEYILDYFQRNPQLVIPVFYMDRSAASNYDKHFEAGIGLNELWKIMRQLDNLPGWDYNRDRDNIDDFNRKIARQVYKMLNRAPLDVTVYPVGLESRLEEVWRLLKLTSSNRGFLNIGLYGLQGIGKSVLARAVYNSIAHLFEVSCFLRDIRENSNTRGLVGVQKMLLSEISGETYTQLENVSEGVSMIKDRLCQKDVLLILDDVDSLEQLEALGRGLGWRFGSCSRVIITTQNKDLLRYHGSDMLLYEVQALIDKDALELLSHKAFDDGNVDPGYTEVLNRAIRYAFGHPLVLGMIGSTWKGKSVDECKNSLDRLERIRCDGIHGGFTYDDIQRIQRASTTSPNGCGISTPLIDTEGSQTERNGVGSHMDFRKVMLILVFFASSVGGLLCNALSPPFKRSIRWWTLFKFFPFVVFFLAVVAVIQYLYPRRIISGHIKCCICYGIFLSISVYSYFYERAVDGKPGILSLVSNGMFALAALSLSKLFEAGFETGIFNYYLQCFMIQLLIVDWKLIFVAIIIAVPLFDWHFSAELFLLTRITKWFGTIRR